MSYDTSYIILDPETYEEIDIALIELIQIGVVDILCIPSGDIYLGNNLKTYIYDYNNNAKTSIITNSYKMEYNVIDENVYCVTPAGVSVINTTSMSVVRTYAIPSIQINYIYSEPVYGGVYVWGDVLYKILDDVLYPIPYITNVGTNDILYNNFTNDIFVSHVNNPTLTRIGLDNSKIYGVNIANGQMVVNQFDSNVYVSDISGTLKVINSFDGSLVYSVIAGCVAKKMLYNPDRTSVVLMSENGLLYELRVIEGIVNIIAGTYSGLADTQYGIFADDFIPNEQMWLQTREYLRFPRENYSDDVQVKYIWKFADDQVPDMFMYDVSGMQLINSPYPYRGVMPLQQPVLNRTPNLDPYKIYDSTAQQTIFDEITYTLDYIDSNIDLSTTPVPMELFLGYNSSNEGYEKSTLNLYRRESVSFSIIYDSTLNNDINLIDKGIYGIIQMNSMSSDSFVYDSLDKKRGFKVGQIFELLVVDITNNRNKYISYNNGKQFQVRELYNNQIVVDYINDVIVNESSIVIDSVSGATTYLKFTFNVIDKIIATIDLYGQTEIEDIRYKIELNNTGHNINPDDVFIFKSYDINEQGVDWAFLNKKRKEMIMVRNQIFSYVGSYKAIINAINYFGYNDLLLYEYYRDININSVNFYKLFKVEVSDIFNNTIAGWSTFNNLLPSMPNPNYEETNMFNLTYLITDKQGSIVLQYSLEEVLIKLAGLKKWLENKVIPITHKIIDITGRTDFVGTTYIKHKSFSRKGFKIGSRMTPIDFDVTEAYLMPINSGSTVYNVVIKFKASKRGTLPDDFNVIVKTYKTYLEWNPFTLYSIGDMVTYYNVIYKSVINNNYLYDPRTYNYATSWNASVDYYNSQKVNYNNRIYEYISASSSFILLGTQSVITPAYIINSGTSSIWLDITQWVPQNLTPVQILTEYRNIIGFTYSNIVNNYLFYTASVTPDYIDIGKYNFSIDSNIDPFIVVEVNTSNGYGCNYSINKSYEIRGTNNLYATVQPITAVAPFSDIP